MRRIWFPIAMVSGLALVRTVNPAMAADAAPVAPGLVATEELVLGNGTAGPFPLSWTALRVGSEQITVNETRLHMGLDYLLDYETGSLTFSQPLRRNQM